MYNALQRIDIDNDIQMPSSAFDRLVPKFEKLLCQKQQHSSSHTTLCKVAIHLRLHLVVFRANVPQFSFDCRWI